MKSDDILDSLTGIFSPLIAITEKNFDNNYLIYGIIGAFIIFIGLVGYGFYLFIDKFLF